MISKEEYNYISYLYQEIFGEHAEDSEEFINFVDGSNPHLLRVKVEDRISQVYKYFDQEQIGSELFDLDCFITDYILEHDESQ